MLQSPSLRKDKINSRLIGSSNTSFRLMKSGWIYNRLQAHSQSFYTMIKKYGKKKDFAIRSIRDNAFYIYMCIFELSLSVMGLKAFILIGITEFHRCKEIVFELQTSIYEDFFLMEFNCLRIKKSKHYHFLNNYCLIIFNAFKLRN